MQDIILTIIPIISLPVCLYFLFKSYKHNSCVTFLNDKCHIDIEKDIEKYYLCEEKYANSISCSVVCCVIPSIFLKVIIRIKANHCATGDRLKGYLLFEYYCQPNEDGFQFLFRGGFSVLAKRKLFAKPHFFGWVKDDAKRFLTKQEKLKATKKVAKKNIMETLHISSSEKLKICATYLNLIMRSGVELDRNRKREELYHLLSNITNELLFKTSGNLLEVNQLYLFLETMGEINDLYNAGKAYLAGKFSKQKNVKFHIGLNHYCNSISNLARESGLLATKRILYYEVCSLLGDKNRVTELLRLWREANGLVRYNIDVFFRLGYEYDPEEKL